LIAMSVMEGVIVYFKILPRTGPGGLRKTMKKSSAQDNGQNWRDLCQPPTES
jgi:hypothetical protein